MNQAVSPLWILWELGGWKVHSDQSWRHRLLLGRGGGLGKVAQRVAGPREGSCQCLGLGEDTLAGRDCTCHALGAETSCTGWKCHLPLGTTGRTQGDKHAAPHLPAS